MRQPWLGCGLVVAGVAWLAGGSMGFGGGGDGPSAPTSTKLGDPLRGLAAVELARFNAGKVQFQEAEDPAGGLGPVFNDRSCVACHEAGATGARGPAGHAVRPADWWRV